MFLLAYIARAADHRVLLRGDQRRRRRRRWRRRPAGRGTWTVFIGILLTMSVRTPDRSMSKIRRRAPKGCIVAAGNRARSALEARRVHRRARNRRRLHAHRHRRGSCRVRPQAGAGRLAARGGARCARPRHRQRRAASTIPISATSWRARSATARPSAASRCADRASASRSRSTASPRAAARWSPNPIPRTLARQHNDANVLALGARLIGEDMAKACVDRFPDRRFRRRPPQPRASPNSALPTLRRRRMSTSPPCSPTTSSPTASSPATSPTPTRGLRRRRATS